MFIIIRFISTSGSKAVTEVCLSDAESAFTTLCVLERAPNIIAWNMVDHKPEDFGWAKIEEWPKGRLSFTQKDYQERG